jgi:hypothetical protein
MGLRPTQGDENRGEVGRKGTALAVPQIRLCSAALAAEVAEVRFLFDPNYPQGLKPSTAAARCGTAKPVPFRRVFRESEAKDLRFFQ